MLFLSSPSVISLSFSLSLSHLYHLCLDLYLCLHLSLLHLSLSLPIFIIFIFIFLYLSLSKRNNVIKILAWVSKILLISAVCFECHFFILKNEKCLFCNNMYICNMPVQGVGTDTCLLKEFYPVSQARKSVINSC